MATGQGNNNAEVITKLLRRIGRGDDPRLLCEEAHKLIQDVNPKDIVTAEQTLVEDGFPARTVQQLSAAFMFMGMHPEHDDGSESTLGENHILRKAMIEHDLMRCLLADLDEVVGQIRELDELRDVGCEFRRLVHITSHLNVMKEHIEREEYVIFPYLRKYGWAGLCRAAQGDHLKIGIEIDNLVRLVLSFNDIGFEQFKQWLLTVTARLTPIALEHLWYEDEILYPMALGVINDTEVWEKIKAVCEEIGYCGIHH